MRQDRNVTEVGAIGRQGSSTSLAEAARPALLGHRQALGQQQVQLIAQPLLPMAEARAFVGAVMLEERLASEVPEVRIVDSALADAFVGQPVDMLEQQQAWGLNPGPDLVEVRLRFS